MLVRPATLSAAPDGSPATEPLPPAPLSPPLPVGRTPRNGAPEFPRHAPEIPVSRIPAPNVASVPQRSPLRYPGGKTWLIPHIRSWLGHRSRPAPLLIEPFAGGGVVSLTAVMEGLAERCLMAELDPDVAAFWHAAVRDTPALIQAIRSFVPERDAVEALARQVPATTFERGFRALVLNRTRRGGILAPGASLSRSGENGKGLASRWYPDTIVRRLAAIEGRSDRIAFCHTDGLQLLGTLTAALSQDCVVFVDPPYTAGGKRAGKRLYAHHALDHGRLFRVLAESRLDFLMTYDEAPEVLSLVRRHGLHAARVLMKNTHHARLPELVITRRPMFARPPG